MPEFRPTIVGKIDMKAWNRISCESVYGKDVFIGLHQK